MSSFIRYVRRHHIGLLALFIALGGTSYAAVALPANSVGTKQIEECGDRSEGQERITARGRFQGGAASSGTQGSRRSPRREGR